MCFAALLFVDYDYNSDSSFDVDVSFLDFRPSVVAAAAVLAASDDQLTRKALGIKMEFISLENVSFFSCSA